MNDVCAVYVIYNPDVLVFRRSINSTINQVDFIYIINNGITLNLVELLPEVILDKIELVDLVSNKGVATGLNVGIRRSVDAGYKYVLFLDQDSIISGGIINKYLHEINNCCCKGARIAALGARYISSSTGRSSSFVRFYWFRNQYVTGSAENNCIDTDFLITSGSFCRLEVFDQVGLFNDDLFIDHVDTEWCLRAKSMGYQCYGIWDAVMQHSLGEGGLRLWFFRWREHPRHKPFRLYFIVRNSLLLYRMPHVNFKWISADVFRLMRVSLIHLIFFPERMKTLRFLSLGLLDGIRGVAGEGKAFSGSTAESPDDHSFNC